MNVTDSNDTIITGIIAKLTIKDAAEYDATEDKYLYAEHFVLAGNLRPNDRLVNMIEDRFDEINECSKNPGSTPLNLQDMTNRQVTAAAKKLGIKVIYATSCGGGREDPNRDHRTWFVEIMIDGDEWIQEPVSDCMVSGRWDGKQACERAAKRIALEQVIRRGEAA